MTITLIIIAYILNVFLNRWLNYIIYEKNGNSKAPFIWFLSIITTIIFIIAIMIYWSENENWFTGKYWKKK
jgi:branched-subunit amino acid transport protein AzlD